MVMTVKHKYASTIVEGGTSGTVGGYVGPTEWNDFHTLLLGVNAQVGTTYTFVDGDLGLLVTGTNAAAQAYALPQAGAASQFVNGWFAWAHNRGAGALTITPATSTIDGATTLVLQTGQGAMLFSDGTNYYTMRGITAVPAAYITYAMMAAAALAATGDFVGNTASKLLNPASVWADAAPLAVADSATYTPAFNTNINFVLTLGATCGATGTLANPSGTIKPGQTGVITCVQDATGGRKFTTWGTYYKVAGTAKPVLSTAANAIDDLAYWCKSATEIHLFPSLAFG